MVGARLPSAGVSLFAQISDHEIAWACTVMRLPLDAFYGVEGDDPRLSVMRSLETLDVEACPGSGKTTLLVAKLAILANRWNSRRQGVCVLSHTNAARNEIGSHLCSTSTGHLLLQHPHFVGTIHSFVNEFVALPWLRSKGWCVKAIDTEIALNDRWRRLPVNTRKYLERQRLGPAALGYSRTDFGGCEKGNYSSGTDTYRNMLKACRDSTAEGYYCFDEMFVWAHELLDRSPEMLRTIRARFPMVFVDEVQDNSELQSAFLHRLFIEGGGAVVRQRFGDSNQAIYHRSGAKGAVTDTFPGPNKADLPVSFRFSQAIADLADPLGISPRKMIGRGPTMGRVKHDGCQSVLFLFDDASVLGVLPAYAQHLIETFSDDALLRGDFTAVAGVHRSDKVDHLPRFMGHYAPDYDPDVARRQPKPSSFAQHLARARLELSVSRNIHPVANYCAEGILQFVRKAGRELPEGIRKSANRYVRELLPDEDSHKLYATLLDCLVGSRCDPSKEVWTAALVPNVLSIGKAIVGREIGEPWATEFLGWSECGAAKNGVGTLRKPANLFRYPYDDPKVSIRLGSIHGVKGETHTATLVLESFHQTHHLKKLIPWLTGKRPKPGLDNSGEDIALIERLKLHYVAMTRPSHLLCFAMRSDTLTTADREAIEARGMRIIECVPPLAAATVEVV